MLLKPFFFHSIIHPIVKYKTTINQKYRKIKEETVFTFKISPLTQTKEMIRNKEDVSLSSQTYIHNKTTEMIT